MLQLQYQVVNRAFQYPFTTSKGTKTHQPTLVVSLGLGAAKGYGEAPAISYYDVTAEGMAEVLASKKAQIERYSLTEPSRFWHFLHHLIPGQHFLTAALDIAAWDLFAKLRRVPLHKALGISWEQPMLTDYTLGIDSLPNVLNKLEAQPWPLYKIKVSNITDIEVLRQLRKHTRSPFRIDANEAWSYNDCITALPELLQLGVTLVEQPLARNEVAAMTELKALSPIPLFADESCQTETDVKACAAAFHGINIKLTKCGGITPALRMIKEARSLGLKIMLGSMNEGMVGTAALAHLAPLVDELDADGPLLLEPTGEQGLAYHDGKITISNAAGLGVRFV